jgi:hypothetical protein
MAYDDYGNWIDDEIYGPDFGLTPGVEAWNGTSLDDALQQQATSYSFNDASTGDTRTQDERIAAYDSPYGSTQYDGSGGRIDNVLGDTSSLEQQLRDYAGSMYDPTDLEGILRNTGYQTGGSSLSDALANQFGIYDQRAASDGGAGGSGAYSYGGTGSGSSGSGSGGDALSQFMDYLSSRQSGADGYQSQLRDMLLNQIGVASQPVSASDPGIKQAIDAMALEAQRTAERQQSMLAARTAADGVGDSGTQDTGMIGIEQLRGESVMKGTGTLMYQELNNRRQQLTQLLNLAVSSGDQQAAQAIQAQLASLTLQLQNQQYYAGLDNNRYQFDNDLGYRLLMAELLGNQNAIGALL